MLLYFITRMARGITDTVELNGAHWGLTSEYVDGKSAVPFKFICVSYSWGLGRAESPFHDMDVSDRTTPVLKTVINLRPQCAHFWVDAFCVPQQIDERTRCLESMGFIYSQAQEVIAVLGKQAEFAIQQVHAKKDMHESHFDALEEDPWITRAWTYQEAANAQRLFLTYEASDTVDVSEDDFLNHLGNTLMEVQNVHAPGGPKYPFLSELEDLLVDCMIHSGLFVRSALSVMISMERREQGRADDHFYAMIGAISNTASSASPGMSASESFMSVCEKKGDYSFIYSAAKRDDRPSRRWRPVGDSLSPILCWSMWGTKEEGHEDGHQVYLDNMFVLEQKPDVSPLLPSMRYFLSSWYKAVGIARNDEHIVTMEDVRSYFQSLGGFSGSAECIVTEHGLFFPLERIEGENITVLVSGSIRWTFGAPGLARHQKDGMLAFTPGVFVCETLTIGENLRTMSVLISE